MKITREKILAHVDDVAHVLEFVAGAVGLPDAAVAVEVVASALKALESSIHGHPVDLTTQLAELRKRFADNDAHADDALSAKFDHGGEG